MIHLKRTASYWWPVKVPVAQDGGNWTEEVFSAHFRRLSVEQMQDLKADVVATKMSDEDYAARVMLDWRDVADETGQSMPYTRENLKALCQLPGVSACIVLAFLDSFAKAPEKNS